MLSKGVRLNMSNNIRQLMKREDGMNQYKLGEMEQKFAELIWERAPVTTGELVKLCQEAFQWKRTTTYTMLKRLCDRGIFANDSGTVIIRISREEFQGAQSELFLRETFGGSLPLFLAAFSSRKRLNEKEIASLKKLIEEYEE